MVCLDLLQLPSPFKNRGGQIEIVVGIDEGITTKQALEILMELFNKFICVPQSFRKFPQLKVYMFEAIHKSIVFMGSSNLTTGGLLTNYEANLELELDLSDPADPMVHHQYLAVFSSFTNLTTGNTKIVSNNLIKELMRINKIENEFKRITGRSHGKRIRAGELFTFPRIPIPPAPLINPELMRTFPITSRINTPDIAPEVAITFHPWQTFIMTLGIRDTRQKKGFLCDVYIPLSARDANQEFWGWPIQSSPGVTPTIGNYMERRINMLIRPISGTNMISEDVRLYYYDIKHEFRY